jgi:hypothetical protein
LSQKVCVPVDAFALSLPAATSVMSGALVDPLMPDPPSVAVHKAVWFVPCQTPSEVDGTHWTTGVFLSIFQPVIGPAVVQLPCTSQSACVFVEALAVSVPTATFVDRTNAAGELACRPDASLAVQLLD